MWNYYGSKSKVIKYYPKPKHNLIVEPFAGSAQYAYLYFENDIILVDQYKVITDLWQWLQKCSKHDIDKLPRLKKGQTLDDFNFDCQEARNLVGFTNGFGLYEPRLKISSHHHTERPNSQNYRLQQVAANLHKIKHWHIMHGSYEDIGDLKATWFIDPPYQIGGHCYKHGNKNINYSELAKWCYSRRGFKIVCEGPAATWLPFKPLVTQKVGSGMYKESVCLIKELF